MECVQHIVCRSCYLQLGKEQDVLMCGGCKLWQHRKCVPDVLPSFYAQFYVSVLQEQKPKHWLCNYCSKYATTEPNELGIKSEKGNACTTLVPHANSPIPMDISDSESELHMSFENNRIEREGQAQSQASSLSSLEDQAIPGVEILISSRPACVDIDPLPTTFTLYKKSDGQKFVKDCHGNEFKKTMRINPYVTVYTCVSEGCRFIVQTYEDKKKFLSGGHFIENSHDHDMPGSSVSNQDREQMEDNDISVTPSLPTPRTTPYTTPALHRRPVSSVRNQDREQMEDNDISVTPSLPTPRTTPYTTPAHNRRSMEEATRHRSERDNSTTDDGHQCAPPVLQMTSAISANTNHLTLQRFSPLTTPKLRKSNAKFHLSSSSSSSDDSSDDMNTAINHGRPASNDIVNTCSTDSSDSSDEEPENTKSIPERPVSRNQARKGDREPENTKPIPDRQVSRNQARKGNREPDSASITYTLTDGLASGNQSRLTDSQGYCYQIKYKLGARVYWTCTEKVGRCSATVIQQRQDKFIRGVATHNHEPGKSQNTLTSTSANEELPVKSAATTKTTQHNVKSSAIAKPIQQNVKSSATVKTTQQSVKSSAIAKPIQQDVKSSAAVKTTQQNVKSSAIAKPTQQSAMSAATVKTTQQNAMSAATVKTTQQNATTLVSATCSTSTPLTTTDVLYQEITTCTEYYNKPKSALTGSDGYVYKTKKVEKGKDLTVWKCTHKGPRGKCKGQVQYNYTTSTFADYSDPFIWTEDHKNVTVTVPHNHQPDMESAVIIKMKAMIHRQVYGYGYHNDSAKTIIGLAKDSMCDREKQHVPTGQLVKRLKKWLWEKQRQYRDCPRACLHRFLIDRHLYE